MSDIKSNSTSRQEDLPTIAVAAPTAPAGGKSPGTSLREARESLGMSIADAAQAIRLSQRQITQLEEDAWDQLPGETFVRGFLRNYARLLKLDPEPLLASVHNPEPQAIELPESSKEELPVEGSSGGQMVPILAGAGLLLVAAVLVYLFWPQTPPRSNLVGKPPAPPVSSAPADASAATAGGAAVTEAPPQATANDSAAATTAGVPKEVVAPVVATPPAADTAKEAAATPPPPAKTPVAETPRAAVAAPDTARTPAPTDGTGAESSRPFVVVDGPQRALRIAVRELSWVEVRDAGGNTLIAYNFEPGTVRNVRGVAPLEIIVGNAAGVDVSVDGKPIDVAAQARANVAKLTVE